MRYKVTAEDIEKCFEFAVKYHLDERTLSTNRTTGQYRGLGGIIDSFIVGKLIEIGVAKLINSQSKKMILDFDIHGINKENINDPDIVRVKDNNSERDPNIFVEIKNISPEDRWVGLTMEQFETMKRSRIVNNNNSNIYIIYASLISTNSNTDSDLLGVYLKSKMNDEIFSGFSEVNNLYVEIKYIITGEDLATKGTEFRQGSFLYETEIFQDASSRTSAQIIAGTVSNMLILEPQNNELPIVMRDKNAPPREFGRFTLEGSVRIYKKENASSDRMYLHCLTDVKIKNNVLGEFNLTAGKVYDSFFTTVGMNPALKRNNIWIANRNLKNIQTRTTEELISSILREI